MRSNLSLLLWEISYHGIWCSWSELFYLERGIGLERALIGSRRATQTYVGNVLISVNPYKPLTLYAADGIETYKTRAVFELPPHVYVSKTSLIESRRSLS